MTLSKTLLGSAVALVALAGSGIALAETSTTNMCVDHGYARAAWQCYDGTEGKSGSDTTCRASDMWHAKAEESCKGHCSRETGKCGINSFRVEGECTTCDTTTTPTTAPSCPDVTETILKCEVNGLKYEKTMKDGCTFVRCLTAPVAPTCNTVDADAKRCKESGMGAERIQGSDGCWHATCTTVEQTCSMTKDDVYAKAKACETAGGKPVVKTSNNCAMFVECARKTPEPTKQSETVACKKWMENSCVLISCEDGFRFNSCDQMCPLTSPAGTTTVKPQGRCSEYERLVKELKEKLKNDPKNADLTKQVREANTKMDICLRQLKAASSSSMSTKTIERPSVTCTVVQDGGCSWRVCGDKKGVISCDDTTKQQ